MSEEIDKFKKQFDEINERLDKIIQLIAGTSTLNSVIANRLNKIESTLSNISEKSNHSSSQIIKPKATIEISSPNPTPSLPPLPPREIKTISMKSDFQNLKDADPEIVFKKKSLEDEEVVFVDVEEKELNVPKCPITVKVVTSQGTNVFNAPYEVFGKGDKLITSGRTNGVGKISCMLPLGTYKIVVRRKDPILQKSVDATTIFQVKVLEPMQLPDLVIPTGKK